MGVKPLDKILAVSSWAAPCEEALHNVRLSFGPDHLSRASAQATWSLARSFGLHRRHTIDRHGVAHAILVDRDYIAACVCDAKGADGFR